MFYGAESALRQAQIAHGAETERQQMPDQSFGKGEVESSILSGSTIFPNEINGDPSNVGSALGFTGTSPGSPNPSTGSQSEFYVEIRPFSDDPSDPGYLCMGPTSRRDAERIDRGANINLNHERYYTMIVRAEDRLPSSAGGVRR